MATNFPTSLDSLTNPATTDQLNSPSHAAQHADANDAIEQLQAKVGVNSSAVTTSHDYKIAQLEAAITAGVSGTKLIYQDVRNQSGVSLTKGTPVRVTGSDGASGKLLIGAASNANEAGSSKTFGLVSSTINNNSNGQVVTNGLLENVDTTGAVDGDPVWLGVNGAKIFGLVNKPVAPAHLVYLGVVVRGGQQNTGSIFVSIQNGFEVEELHNVLITSVANKNALVYDSTTQLWKNYDLSNDFVLSGDLQNSLGDYIPLSVLGEPDGVAKLDLDGNLIVPENKIIIEGATADAHELTLQAPDVTSDITVTLPNASGTLALTTQLFSGSYTDLTNKPNIVLGAPQWTANHTLLANGENTRYLIGDIVYDGGNIYVANFENESIPTSNTTYWTSLGSGKRLNIDGRDIPNITYDQLNGKPTIPSLTGYATENYVSTAISNLVDTAPTTLDTLNELAAALGDDPNYAATITTALGNKLDSSTAASTYLTQTNAESTYLTQTNASSTYLTQTSASSTYAPIASPTFTGNATFSQNGIILLSSTTNAPSPSYSLNLALNSTTGNISLGYNQTTGALNLGTGPSRTTGVINIGTGVTITGTKTINVGTGSTGGITAITIGSSSGATSNVVLNGNITLPSTTSIGDVSSTEISYLNNVTSSIQTQIDLKAALASPTFTGTPSAPTAAVGTDTTQIATTAFVIDQIDASTQPGALYQTTAPTSPEIGQIWIDSDENVTTFDSNIIRRKTVTATAGQTVFTTDVPFIDGFEQVFMNGLLLVKTTDYATSNSNTVTLTSGAAVSDIIEIVTVTGANSVSTYTQAETDALLAANTSVAPLSISANTTLVAKKRYFVTSASALTLTLPASPALNDEIQILDASGNASTYNITVARNGNKINGGTGNLIIDNNGGWYTLLYTGSTYGWKVG